MGHNTNEKGAIAVAEAFPEYFVIPIYMEKLQALHLKSVCSMAGKQVIAMSTSKDGEEVLKVCLVYSKIYCRGQQYRIRLRTVRLDFSKLLGKFAVKDVSTY